ncbi:PhzF family phenazine biosynthesis protein [Devosia sp.]|uniref:PhzF family phenazine biosynthesis protein n=1 Tax=Devosia sp. TaxID=1871048 RepID=UPI003A8F5209
MKLAYQILDVFTNQRLSGNPLAVVLKADNLSDSQMQAIAREFNLSETVFVKQPQFDRHAANVRIFTPDQELPFAGHPTIGAAAVVSATNRSSAIRLEEKIGTITCLIERPSRSVTHVRFGLPELPERIADLPDTDAIAASLGIAPEDIGCGAYRPCVFGAGTVMHLVPVRNASVLKRLKLDSRGWEDIYVFGRGNIYVFTETPEEQGNDLAARMFAPGISFTEDPATGSAAAALIGLLAEQMGEGTHDLKLRQGVEMQRASLIELQFTSADGAVTRASIGGSAVNVAEGTLDLFG